MSPARYIIGDTRKVLATLPDDSVDLVFTSPPFLGLRSYLPADHPDKGSEIGSEATPGEFLDVLLDVVEECARVLAPHGSLVFELGDTYAGSKQESREDVADASARWGGAGGRPTLTGFRGGTVDRLGDGWPLAKSLCMIPQLFAFSLAYGFNPLTGRETDRWRVRNVVAWCRPNPPVGALGDKFRPATSMLTVACKGRRWFDLDAVREASVTDDSRRDEGPQRYSPDGQPARQTFRTSNPAGAPPLDFWVIPTEPYPGSHYATFPRQLVVRPVKSMCPEKVCRVCGKPSERITEQTEEYAAFRSTKNAGGHKVSPHAAHVGNRDQSWDQTDDSPARGPKTTTLGWTDCGHDDWRPGVVLDPFAGSGTTLAVATGHGRDAIGIDLDERNAELACERVGPMFFELEHLDEEGAA